MSYERVFVAWPDEKKGPFVLEAKWVEESGRPVCVGLTIWKGVLPQVEESGFRRLDRSVPLDGIGGTDLRSIPLARILEQLWAGQRERDSSLRGQWERIADSLPPDDPLQASVTNILAGTAAFHGDGPKRRQAADIDHFRAVAAVYQAAMATPGRKRPTEAVRSHFGVSHSTATKWVHHAREVLDLLPPTTPGKPAAAQKTTSRPRRGER